MCAISVAALGLSTAGTAVAAPVTVPFQVNPAPYGNPNGSFDAPAPRCAAVVGAQPGAVVITGGNPGGWGCPLTSQVQWMNLSTGATGTTHLSDGLNGIPAAATVNTGIGQVVAVVNPVAGIVTPGFATFYVP
ncbi:hypothetical protein FCG67_14685 [Rhodococcus oryzae]|uniref:Secreted protein n=2 Tax=Rhodococcus oryzae TaxID=2571143 RepID=A0ABY2RJ26_9NOCA|nr:hypothetical protein FCG67_14685 [Rhodococcus oryzae]